MTFGAGYCDNQHAHRVLKGRFVSIFTFPSVPFLCPSEQHDYDLVRNRLARTSKIKEALLSNASLTDTCRLPGHCVGDPDSRGHGETRVVSSYACGSFGLGLSVCPIEPHTAYSLCPH